MSGPRVRIAPSPTGFFHVGTARTALFNWLFAHQSHGAFILRIEDTDTERNIEEAREGIITAMQWLDLNFDEGPFLQSDLLSDHGAVIQSSALAVVPSVAPMPGRSSRGVDVTIAVGPDVAPGIYRGTAMAEGFPELWLPIAVTVWQPTA